MCLYEHNFTRFYLKENKTIRVHVKDKSCNSPEGLQLHSCFCEYSKSFKNIFFYRTTLLAAFELCFSIRKEFLKKKISGDIAFELISLFHVQIQETTNRSTTTREFVFLAKFAEFYYHKIFETRS